MGIKMGKPVKHVQITMNERIRKKGKPFWHGRLNEWGGEAELAKWIKNRTKIKADVYTEMFNDKANATNEYVQWLWLADLFLSNYVWHGSFFDEWSLARRLGLIKRAG